MKSRKRSDRRRFLKNSLKTGVGLGVFSQLPLFSRQVFAQLKSDADFKPQFIVIGAGAGGGPLAARLARLGYRVLVLEAGGRDVDDISKTPAFHGLSTEHPTISWNYFVKHYAQAIHPQDSKFEADKGGILYPRSSGIGGSTLHNAMITMYPDASDWNDIMTATGDKSWNAKSMREYFVRLENNRYLGLYESTAALDKHGLRGWLSTERSRISFALKDRFFRELSLAAFKSDRWGLFDDVLKLLFSPESDQLSPGLTKYDSNRNVRMRSPGPYLVPKATMNGVRRGPREWLLETEREFPENLKIVSNALVTRLLFTDPLKPQKVTGVEYRVGEHLYEASPLYNPLIYGATKTALAEHEVVLSGGAFNTPQILMLSGIGDEARIPSSIRMRKHLPGVGRGLQDRYEVGVVCRLREPIASLTKCTFEPDPQKDPCFNDYKKDQGGSLYGTNGVIVGRIHRSSKANPPASGGKPNPDLFVFAAPGYFKGYESGWSRRALQNDHFTWAVLKSHTANRQGEVTLNPADPTNPQKRPDICFNYFKEGEQDLEAVAEGVELAREMNAQSGLAQLIDEEVLPGRHIKGESLRQFIRREAWGHHASCTSKMGPSSDPMAVVDSAFRVHGIEGLRIVDASVFPNIPGMFIVLPIYMIAEKAASVIAATYRKRV